MKNKLIGLLWLVAAPCAMAELPPPDAAAKAKAEATAARQAWSNKVAAYKLCESQDQVAAGYFADAKATGKPVKAPMQTPPCVDPGPFSAAASGDKPLESSGAHSPAATAASPPSEREPEAETAPAAPDSEQRQSTAPASSAPSADEKAASDANDQKPAAPAVSDTK